MLRDTPCAAIRILIRRIRIPSDEEFLGRIAIMWQLGRVLAAGADLQDEIDQISRRKGARARRQAGTDLLESKWGISPHRQGVSAIEAEGKAIGSAPRPLFWRRRR
jgi:hypothetical protein